MTTILALDTSTGACSAALWVDGEIYSEWRLRQRDHTRIILPMVDRVLAEAGKDLSAVDAIGFTAGPGSFTGLRIGLGVVQGLAFGADIPVIPVSTLEVLALVGVEKYRLHERATILVALDARMHEVYWGLYEYGSSGVQPLIQDRVDSPDRVSEVFSMPVSLGVGSGWIFANEIGVDRLVTDADLEPDARQILQLAVPRYRMGNTIAVTDVRLAYLREQITWKKREKLRPDCEDNQ